MLQRVGTDDRARIGFWVDMEDAYVTYSNEYIETGWWIFKRLWDNDLVFQDFRVTPALPALPDEPLESHEIAQGYEDDTPDPASPCGSGSQPMRQAPIRCASTDGVPTSSMLAWTTTPWTLSGNTALAVSARGRVRPRRSCPRGRAASSASCWRAPSWGALSARRARSSDAVRAPICSASSTSRSTRSPLRVGGAARVRRRSHAALKANGDPLPARRVIASDEVTTEEGTGILHVAPAFGEADYADGPRRGADVPPAGTRRTAR